MRIIPVLDLKGGKVVRAEKGSRDLYQPIVTPLADGADPSTVAAGLRTLYPFDTFYCADLDAIEGGAADIAALAGLRAMPNAPGLWVDAGLADAAALAAALADPGVYPVLGSESQRDAALLAAHCHNPRLILSLDFFADGFRGPQAILEQPQIWPRTIIVMTLAKVGARAGPDFERLARISEQAADRLIVAAGGVRGEADVRALSDIGVGAALVATSLHDGTLTPAQLAAFAA